MKRAAGRGAAALGAMLAISIGACGGASAPAVATPPAPAPPKAPAPAPPAPLETSTKVRWELHPVGGARVHAKLALDAETAVYVGDSGDRWLARAGGPAQSAPGLLPEPLATVARSDTGGLWFVAVSGNVYPASDPLGPVGEPRRPPFLLHSVSAGRAALVALSETGRIVRSVHGGASWSDVSPAHDTVTEVAMARTGQGLALIGPTRLLASSDDGATWAPLPPSETPFAHVLAGADGALYAQGKTQAAALRDGALAIVSETPAPTYVLPEAEGALPYATMLSDGRAAIVGAKWVGIVAVQGAMHVASRAVDEPLKLERAADLDRCKQAYLGGSGESLVVACDARAADGDPKKPAALSILVRDAGGAWRTEATLASGAGVKRIWLTEGGAILVAGACLARGGHPSACAPKVALPLVRPAGATAFAVPAKIKTTVGFAAVAAAHDRIYALAYDEADGTSTLFVSKDGGRTFGERSLPEVMPKSGPPLKPRAAASLSAGDGAVIAAVQTTNGWLVYETRDDGKTFDIRVPHVDGVRALAFADRRGFAWDPSGRGYESIDGGATWSLTEAPKPPATPDGETAPAEDPQATPASRRIACTAAGCFVGDGAVRFGWTR